MSARAANDERRPSFARVALRWLAVIVIAGVVSYASVRGMDRYRADAARRVFAADWARFEGCLFGRPSIDDAALPDAALALARGTGDPAWPHTCSRPLTRVATAAAALAAEQSSEEPLKRAATAMESALGEAVFWTGHVQARRIRPATWIAAFITLRREVRAWATRTSLTLPSPELPAHPRVPRPANEPEDPPPPEPLLGGDEADVVDAIATPTTFAWIFRDRRSRYTRCSMPWRDPARPEAIRCEPMMLGPDGDPRDLGLIVSDDAPWIVASRRSPSDVRAVLAFDSLERRLDVAGMSRSDRDFVAANGEVWGVHRARFSLAVRRSGDVERALPSDADTLWNDRAMGLVRADVARPVLVWLRVQRGGRAALRSIDLSSMRANTLALRGDWSSYDRSLEQCTSGPWTLWLARDGHGGAHVFDWGDGLLRLMASLEAGITAAQRFRCDHRRWALIERGETRVRARLFDGARELPAVDLDVAPPFDVALADGGLVVADAGGPQGALRVRMTGEGRSLVPRRTYPVLASPRGVRVIADSGRVLVLARAARTHAFIVSSGSELEAASLAQAAPALDAPRR